MGGGWTGRGESEDVGARREVDRYLFPGGSGEAETRWEREGWGAEAVIGDLLGHFWCLDSLILTLALWLLHCTRVIIKLCSGAGVG